MALVVNVERGSDYRLGATALFLAAVSILTALGFQYIGGYQPCMLCLMQRYAVLRGDTGSLRCAGLDRRRQPRFCGGALFPRRARLPR